MSFKESMNVLLEDVKKKDAEIESNRQIWRQMKQKQVSDISLLWENVSDDTVFAAIYFSFEECCRCKQSKAS